MCTTAGPRASATADGLPASASAAATVPPPSATPVNNAAPERSAVARGVPVPEPPFFGSRTVRDIRLEKVYEYINETALIRGQWQVKRGTRSEEEYEKELQDTIYPRLRELKLQMKRENVLRPAVVYGYFPCHSDGNDLVIYRPKGAGEAIYLLPRSKRGKPVAGE